MRTAPLAIFLLACSPGDGDFLLDEDFPARLTDGYACGIDGYVAFDEDRTIRLQAGFPNVTYYGDVTSDEGILGADGPSLTVYTGKCLWTPGCSDDVNAPSCDQRIEQTFEAVSGDLSLWEEEGGVAGHVANLVLESRRGDEAPIALAELDLALLPFWTE